jgi:hypothetical protein
MEPTCTPQATKHKEQKKKKRELDFLPRFGHGAHSLSEATKQKEKKGSWPLSKVGNGAHQNQNQNKKRKKKKENRMITFKLMLPNFSLLKLQALQSSSSELPKPKHSTCW